MECNVYKKTTDIWLSCDTLNTGELILNVEFKELTITSNDPKQWLVNVYGDDDCYMQKTFNSEKEAWCIFLQIIGLDNVTISSLSKLGLK